jgi:hypothetical protein
MESRDRCVVAYDNGSRGEAGEASECPSSCGGGGRGMEREAGRIRVWVENGERRRIADRTTGIVCDWGAAVIGWGGGRGSRRGPPSVPSFSHMFILFRSSRRLHDHRSLTAIHHGG